MSSQLLIDQEGCYLGITLVFYVAAVARLLIITYKFKFIYCNLNSTYISLGAASKTIQIFLPDMCGGPVMSL